jgi:ATP-binding cassette subfamily C protein
VSGWRMLFGELARQRRSLLRVAAWSALEALPPLLSGVLVAAALDRGFLAGRPGAGMAWLGLLAATMVVRAVAVRAMFTSLADTVEPVRDALVRRLVTGTLTRAVTGVDRPDGAGVARLAAQVETVRALLAGLLRTTRQLAVNIVATVLGVAVLAPVLALVVVVPLVLALALFAVVLRGLRQLQRDLVLADEDVARASAAVFDGLRDVAACGAAGRAAQTVGRAIDTQAGVARRLARLAAARTVVVALGGHVPLVVTLFAAGWLVGSAGVTAGQVVGAVICLTVNLLPALRVLVSAVGTWGLQLGVVVNRLHEVTVLPAAGTAAAPDTAPVYRLEADRLRFAYGPAAQPVVDDLSLTVDDGDHVAVVGPSGIGKSTLAHLLTGMLRPDSGTVRLDGRQVLDVAPRQVAYLPQEAYVFAGTLRENLAYLCPHATDADLDRCAAAVGLAPVVDRLGGYDAVLGPDGADLSSGERQLVALVRTYLSPARIVVLDEATEHAFADRPGALVVIAHRISSARRAGRIVLLDGARMLSGTHDELRAASVLYANLVGAWDPAPAAAPR